jgi:hypothetical protein
MSKQLSTIYGFPTPVVVIFAVATTSLEMLTHSDLVLVAAGAVVAWGFVRWYRRRETPR